MITNLKSINFMGGSINESISPKTIYTGKNTTGKSTRANIIAITALGFSPFSTKTSKKPSDILNDFGNGKKMVTEFTCDGVVFERKFTRDSNGKLSNKTRVNKTGTTVAEFAVALANAGNPQIIDLGAFLKLSDNEKINTLFKLYPPGADLSNLDSDIEKSKKAISRLNESIGNNEGAIKKLIESKTAIEMPAGTLAETQAAIEDLTKGVLEAQNALKIAEQKNADEAKEAEMFNTQAQSNKMMEDNTVAFSSEKEQAVKTENVEFENNMNSNQSFAKPDQNIPKTFQGADVAESIQEVIDIMVNTGCVMCAAGMALKMVLRKYKGGAK